MGKFSCHIRRLRAGIALALLAALLAAPTAALADRDGGNRCNRNDDRRGDDRGDGRGGNPSCANRETLVRVDEAECPPNPRRPLLIRKRKCCKSHEGKVHCDHFEHCPNESPS
jgi:hypothetical protein